MLVPPGGFWLAVEAKRFLPSVRMVAMSGGM
jgi:hypothetical protein